MQYNIMDYGALPDGKTNNQKQIQAAIEDCAKTGGRVLVPAGNFLSGTIQLKSNVELYLEKGSVLTASNSPEDIIDFSEDRDAMDGIENGCFLYACHARNITISGEGTIDGQGRKVYLDDNADEGFHECPLAVAGFRARTTYLEDVDGLHYHELCLYFLMDISHTDLLSKGEKFTLLERHHTHKFEWLPFERLEQEYFYPLFLKKEIFHLPEALTLRTELE